MHAEKDAECWTAGWGSVSSYNQDPVQLQTLKVFLYDEDQCYNHSLDFFTEDDYYYDYFSHGDETGEGDEGDYYNGTDANEYNRTIDHFNFNPEVEFCAGHWNGEGHNDIASSCYGDSGGPLVCINPDSTEPKLYGIVSWGFQCGTPSFYAKVSSVIDWFDDVIEGRYPPDPCEGGVCQLPEGTYSPGNKWFSNDNFMEDNDTDRKKRSLTRVIS